MSEITTNPLLDFSGLPKFNVIQPNHVTPAIDALLTDAQAQIDQLVKMRAHPTWQNFVRPLFDATEKLGRVWGQVQHLHSVVDTAALREVYNENLPKLSTFWTALGQNEGLLKQFRKLRQSPKFEQLNLVQQKVVENELRDFRLGGAELPDAQKQRFMEIQANLATLGAKFGEHVLDATNQYQMFIEKEADLAGLPADVIAASKALAVALEKPNTWVFTLHAPSYIPFMQYAEARRLREQLYKAYVTRASEFGAPELDNSHIILDTLPLRHEEAQLLGFKNYAELSLETKMAESPEKVLAFLREIAQKARPFAEKDKQELDEFARQELDIHKLEAWDTMYASEKLRKARYDFSEQEVKQYFQEPRVLEGLFGLLEKLYQVQIKQDQSVATWHPDVKFFELRKNDTPIGGMYVDLYARPAKRGGAWMDEVINRKRLDANNLQLPIAHLVCNFSAPVGEKPACFSHNEVITLFHEAGHVLHHLMTRIEEPGVNGIHGVEWDAVELPSQFMENWCWEWQVLSEMTAHIDTNETLPRPLYDKMIAAKNFQAGLMTLRQIEFALVDMQLHADFDPAAPLDPLDLLDKIRAEIAVLIPPTYNRFLNTFTHIFAGGYAAGYYSYKWAEVLSADAYARFEEEGLFNHIVSESFLREILSVGGSRSALESFTAFRGREPQIDALLRHAGMIGDTNASEESLETVS